MELGRPVSRRTSTRDIVKMYLQRKAAMKQWFKANKQRVSLTTDIWVAQVTRKQILSLSHVFIFIHKQVVSLGHVFIFIRKQVVFLAFVFSLICKEVFSLTYLFTLNRKKVTGVFIFYLKCKLHGCDCSLHWSVLAFEEAYHWVQACHWSQRSNHFEGFVRLLSWLGDTEYILCDSGQMQRQIHLHCENFRLSFHCCLKKHWF